MKIRQTHVLIGVALVLGGVALLLLTYIRARAAADVVIVSIQDEWYYSDTLFKPWHPAGGGPAWSVRYDAKNMLVTGPISVDVDLFGNAHWTNPPDLRELITKQKEKTSTKP